MNRTSVRKQFIPLILTAGAAIGLFSAPEFVTEPIRTTVRDAVLPGHQAVELGVTNVQSVLSRTNAEPESNVLNLESAEADRKREQLRLRQSEIENARLRKQIQKTKLIGVSPYRAAASEPMLIDELIQANVFGETTAALWKSGMLIDKGRREELRESDIVLQDTGPLIDAGTDARLEAGFPVFAGRCVFGRISHVGRWTSSLLHVTDPKFRGHAQIVRKTADGHQFGAEGVLEGRGDGGCRLTLIAADAPISVGDDVYTSSEKETFPFPMYYGQITRAELKPGAAHWEIDVAPAVGDFRPAAIQILRKRLNPNRVSAVEKPPE